MVQRRDLLAGAGGGLLLSLLPALAADRVLAGSSSGPVVGGEAVPVLDALGVRVEGFRPLPPGAGSLLGKPGLQLPPGGQGALQCAPVGVPGTATALGAHWEGELPPGSSVRLLARWRPPRGAWSAWTAMPPAVPGEGDGRAALFTGLLFLPGPGAAIEARLQARAPHGRPLVLTAATLTAIHASPAPAQPVSRFHRLAAGRGLTILPRAAWGCPTGEQSPDWVPFYQDPSHIVVHHTEGPNSGVPAVAQLRSVWYFHTFGRGWGDIGYNYLIDRQGIVYEGRAGGPGVVGAHALYYNNGTIGIGLLGSYQSAVPPREMIVSLARLIAVLAAENGIDPRGIMGGVDGRRYPAIVGHRDVYATACPGDQVYRLLPLLRAAF